MYDHLLTNEQRKLKEDVIDFVKQVPSQLLRDMDEGKIEFPKEFIEEAGKRNLLGLRFAKEYGGRGLGWEDEIVALEEVGVLGTALACLYSLPSIVGEAIDKFGTEEQKQEFLVPTLKGEKFCAEGLTEPRGGSDFFGTTTVAKKDGDDFVISGQKRFIVGAEGADFFLLYARTSEDLPGHKAISAFLVPRDETVNVEYTYGLMGSKGGGTGRVHFKNTRVPKRYLVGKENGAAEIFYQMMIPERMTTSAGAIGMGKAALDVAVDYSRRRKAFGKEIRKFQGVNFKVAESLTKLDAARGLVSMTAKAIDLEDDPRRIRRLVSESKKFTTEAAWETVNHAMQIMGGIGYTNVYPVERYLRDIRLIMIWTGTNEVMNLIIQSEWYKEIENGQNRRDYEKDALNYDMDEEKVFE